MDDLLHCNRLQCRKSLGLEGQAVVTTCSHIFCVGCANELFTASRRCPACDSVLDQPDDVVVSCLNPSADYRTSVLAGLSPNVVMEIATRSLSFWQYQCTQEAIFQGLVLKNAQERATSLETQLQNVLNEAKNEVKRLQDNINALNLELKSERRINNELREKLRASGKDYERLKTQLDHNMRKALIPGHNPGAMLSEAAASVVQGPKATPTVPTRFYPQSLPQARVRSSPVTNEGRATGASGTRGGQQESRSIWQQQATKGTSSTSGSAEYYKKRASSSGDYNQTPVKHGVTNVLQDRVLMHGRYDTAHMDGQQQILQTPSRSSSGRNKSASTIGLVTPKPIRAKPNLNDFFQLDR